MRSRYFPKIRRRRDDGGAVSLAVILLFFLFSGLGLSMIFLSQVYLKLNAWRKWSAVLDIAAENGIKRGFEDLAGILNSAPSLIHLPEDAMGKIRTDPETGAALLLHDFFGIVFPRIREETWEKMGWKSVATCVPRRVEDHGPYVEIRTGLGIESEGALDLQPARKLASLDAELVLLAGRIPLSSHPFLLDRKTEGADPGAFAEENRISVAAGTAASSAFKPRPVLAEGELISEDATPMLGRALHIDLLRPQDLPTSRLRSFLGLEPSAEPVPDGVYLIRNDLGLGGVFVQGDLEEMVTAIEGDTQIIVFRMEAGEWILGFSPSRCRTEFQTPTGSESFDLVPHGMIIVNGRVLSLGGGAMEPDGVISIVTDREIPSILGGVALTIVASDKVTLTSHLILQNVRWQDGIPVIKDRQSQLIIYSTGRDILSGSGREGGIGVAEGAPDALKVQASLTAAGEGFEILGGGRTLELLGGLQTVRYEGRGNALRILPDPRNLAGLVSREGPLSDIPVATILSLRILSWEEY